MDHVTAYNLKKSKATKSNNNCKNARYNFLSHNGIKQRIPQQSVINPNHCNHFVPFIILKKLKQSFKTSWQAVLSSSSKLDTYCTIKSTFSKEPYLDIVKTYTDRVSLTRLRISAHNLEVEMGRRKRISRTDRICRWCNLSLGAKNLENETHFINDCDLYARPRQNLLHKLNNLRNEFQSIPHTNNILLSSSILLEPELTNTPNAKYENQCHQLRLIARFANRSFNMRQKFHESCNLANPAR